MKPKLWVIVGPTGAGKTEAALSLAKKLGNAALVSADSRQVYKGMDIGTAKTNTKLQKTRPSHKASAGEANYKQYLIDIREPNEPMTLAQWQHEAFVAIDDLISMKIAPILVGGTMLYIDSIVYNYSIPEVAPDMDLRSELESREAEDLYEELMAKDPAAGEFIEPKNKRRIIRALEVMETTGRLFSKTRNKRPPKYEVTMLGLFCGWEELERRLRTRAEQMLTAGLLGETQALIDKYGQDMPLLQTINYEQGLAVLTKKITREEALDSMTRANLKYARRQMSWWRGRAEISWIRDAGELIRQLSRD